MANLVIMPRQGQSVESCIITAWHKKKGDKVSEGDIIYSYETDKSAFDEPSAFSGTMLEVFVSEGDVVPCLDPVCIIGNEGEDISSLMPQKDEKIEKSPVAEQPASAENKSAPAAPEKTGEVVPNQRVKISPRARKLALESGVDMTKVVPTGPNGRIIERDINAALDRGERAGVAAVEAFLDGRLQVVPEEKATADTAALKKAEGAPSANDFGEYEEVAMSGVRRAISRSMHASLSEMAQLTLNTSFDATKLMEYRSSLKAGGEALGLPKISLGDMVFFAASRALAANPDVNATLSDDKIRKYKHANIGLAVDTERGLLVPTIFGADTMSLAEISRASKAAAAKAREGALTPDEMSGGTFTVTNLGSLGIESFTPVINPPQVAILGVCGITHRVKEDGTVYPAMGLSLTIDHRALDGAPAAKFLNSLAKSLENFDLLLAK